MVTKRFVHDLRGTSRHTLLLCDGTTASAQKALKCLHRTVEPIGSAIVNCQMFASATMPHKSGINRHGIFTTLTMQWKPSRRFGRYRNFSGNDVGDAFKCPARVRCLVASVHR